MGAKLAVQPVREKRVKLDPQKAPLGQHGSVLLDHGKKMSGRIILRKDHGFAAQRPHLGSDDIKHIEYL